MAYRDGCKRNVFIRADFWQQNAINSTQNYTVSCFSISEVYKQILQKQPELLSYCTWLAKARKADSLHHLQSSCARNLPTQLSPPLSYQYSGHHCEMLGTVHHLNQVQSLWKPCCAVRRKQSYYSSLCLSALWSVLLSLASTQAYSHICHRSGIRRVSSLNAFQLSFHSENTITSFIPAKTTKLNSVRLEASHVTIQQTQQKYTGPVLKLNIQPHYYAMAQVI